MTIKLTVRDILAAKMRAEPLQDAVHILFYNDHGKQYAGRHIVISRGEKLIERFSDDSYSSYEACHMMCDAVAEEEKARILANELNCRIEMIGKTRTL